MEASRGILSPVRSSQPPQKNATRLSRSRSRPCPRRERSTLEYRNLPKTPRASPAHHRGCVVYGSPAHGELGPRAPAHGSLAVLAFASHGCVARSRLPTSCHPAQGQVVLIPCLVHRSPPCPGVCASPPGGAQASSRGPRRVWPTSCVAPATLSGSIRPSLPQTRPEIARGERQSACLHASSRSSRCDRLARSDLHAGNLWRVGLRARVDMPELGHPVVKVGQDRRRLL